MTKPPLPEPELIRLSTASGDVIVLDGDAVEILLSAAYAARHFVPEKTAAAHEMDARIGRLETIATGRLAA